MENTMELVPCSPRKPRAATTTINDLEDSLLTEILVRLPLISAKQCQAVSKLWYALISAPYFGCRFNQQQGEKNRSFVFLFANRFRSQYRVLFTPNDSYLKPDFALKFLPFSGGQEPATMVASCNDLLLCSRLRCVQDVYYIGNPLTLNWAKLPPPPPPTGGCFHVGLMCDHNYDYSTAAAAAAATSAYKYAVVRIPNLNNSTTFKVQVFSSDTGEWRENVVSCHPRRFTTSSYCRNGIPSKGLLFWLSPENGLMGLDPYNGGQLRCFIDLPNELRHHSGGFHNEGFGVCNGRLRLFEISKDPVLGIFFIRIWDLKDYEKREWILKKPVYFRNMVSKNSSWLTEAVKTPEFSPQVLGCEPDDSDVLHIITMHQTDIKVLLCNLRTGTLEVECDAPADSLYINDVITYMLPGWPTPIDKKIKNIHPC